MNIIIVRDKSVDMKELYNEYAKAIDVLLTYLRKSNMHDVNIFEIRYNSKEAYFAYPNPIGIDDYKFKEMSYEGFGVSDYKPILELLLKRLYPPHPKHPDGILVDATAPLILILSNLDSRSIDFSRIDNKISGWYKLGLKFIIGKMDYYHDYSARETPCNITIARFMNLYKLIANQYIEVMPSLKKNDNKEANKNDLLDDIGFMDDIFD